jgi:hypothetical protein
MHRSLIHRTIRRSFAVTEGRKLDTQRIKASVESARYSGCDGLKEATRVVSGIYYSGLIDTELPAVAVTPASQVSLSSRSHTCIMQCGSCSLEPAVRGCLRSSCSTSADTAWIVALVTAAVALYRAGAPRLPLVLLALLAYLVTFDHAFPFGSLTFGGFFVLAAWLELAPGRASSSWQPRHVS